MSNPFSSGPSVTQRATPATTSLIGAKADTDPANPQIVTQRRLAKAQQGGTILGSIPRESIAPMYNGTKLGAGA